MLAPHHLERALHGAAESLVVRSRDSRNTSVATTHAIQDRLGVHLRMEGLQSY